MTKPAPKVKVESKPTTPTPEAAKAEETPAAADEMDQDTATLEEVVEENAKPMEVDDVD